MQLYHPIVLHNRLLQSLSLPILLIFSLSILPSSAYSLEVIREYKHYLINPKNVSDVWPQMRENAPKLKSYPDFPHTASYYWRIRFMPKVKWVQKSTHCDITFDEPILRGEITLHKLRPSITYSDAIIKKSDEAYKSNLAHELKHERIAKDQFTKLENRVRDMLQITHANCQPFAKEVRRLYEETLEEVNWLNRQFDCKEYGFRSDHRMCQPLRRNAVTSQSGYDDSKTRCNG